MLPKKWEKGFIGLYGDSIREVINYQLCRIIYFIGVFVLVVFGSTWLTNQIMSNTPPFILSRLEELKSNKVLMDSIGGFRLFEYSYNEQNFKNGDTVKYSITITGGQDNLVYKGIQIRNSSGSWKIVTDTLIIQ